MDVPVDDLDEELSSGDVSAVNAASISLPTRASASRTRVGSNPIETNSLSKCSLTACVFACAFCCVLLLVEGAGEGACAVAEGDASNISSAASRSFEVSCSALIEEQKKRKRS